MAVINSSAIGEGSPMNEKRQVQKMKRRENLSVSDSRARKPFSFGI